MTRAIDAAGYSNIFQSSDLGVLAQAYSLDPQERLKNYEVYRRYYKGTHFIDHTISKLEADDDEPLVINYCRKLVDLHANFLFKNGFDITIPDFQFTKENDKLERQFQLDVLERTWEINDKVSFGIEAAQMGGVSGDCWVYPSWEEGDDLYEPHVRLDVIPSHYCFPILGGPEGKDRKKVEKLYIVFPKYKEVPLFERNLSGVGKKELITYVEEITKDTIKLYEGGNIISSKPNVLKEIFPVHIPNYIVAGEYFGISDLADLLEIQNDIDNKATDISKIIYYHGSPNTIAQGVQDSDDIQKGANRVWFVPQDSKIYNLEIEGDLKANMDWYKILRQTMLELSSTPEAALATSADSTTNTAAAAAMSVLYLPMIDKRLLKTRSYGLGIKKLNKIILKFHEIADSKFKAKMDALNTPIPFKYQTEIVFPEPFPRNEILELDKKEKKYKLGITNRIQMLKEDGYNEEEAIKIIEQATKERIEDLKAAAQVKEIYSTRAEQENRSGNPSPKSPNPTIQGEKKSGTDETKKMNMGE